MVTGKGGTLTVCAAICTRDRPQQVGRALRSLTTQLSPPARILVVDNAPGDDRTRRLVHEEYPAACYAVQPIAGLDFARNLALRAASEEIVAFMDDDAVADSRWIAGIEAAFGADPRTAICAGRIDPLELETDAQRLFEANGGLTAAGVEPLRLPPSAGDSAWRRIVPHVAWAARVGSGCNLAVRRQFALDLGGFDEALDLGPAVPGGGDTDMIWRALESGAHLVYDPAVRVQHEHRREMKPMVDQLLGHQLGLVAFLAKAVRHSRGLRRIPVLAFLAWRLCKPGLRLARRAVGRDPLPAAVLLRVWWNCWRGLGAYGRGVRLARQRRQAGATP